MRLKYKGAKITFVFHRGDWNNVTNQKEKERKIKIKEILERYDVDSIDISGSCEGFKIYDDADLHVGFRVHAHIYNLSHRKLSILIEEDGRAMGVNQALGLTEILAFKRKYSGTDDTFVSKVKSKLEYQLNPYVAEEVDMILEQVFENGGLDYECAFKKMQFYYEKMIEHIRRISNL